MPKTEVRQFRSDKGELLVQDWLDDLKKRMPKAWAKCVAFIAELREHGHDLHRPYAAPLKDKIYELRPTLNGINYRILYFFQGPNFVVLSHGITKEDVVPPIEISRAVERKKLCEKNPAKYVVEFEKRGQKKNG